ncbi:phenazine biosynthesis protein [Chaetomium tenue]|uniref:Phenazine biosynthesis protein n=1 Tax=Chaetomium tenue TaxID=1854479 RepID=A0ACB7P4V7_9PEZI|nr:phenazine biosynthesis protein [Chaetomium globosum]
MSSLPFTIVDVFSGTPFQGNPLAVVDARDHRLSDTQMKLLTRQFNLSETTFFFRPASTNSKADYTLRSFLSDGKEVFGAGHNILGVWWHLANAGLLDFSTAQKVEEHDSAQHFIFHQELGGEVIPLQVAKPTTGNQQIAVAIRQARPQAHAVHPDPGALAASLGLSVDDIGFAAHNSASLLPPQVMSTSTTRHLLVPVSSVAALNHATVQRDKLLEQLRLVDEKSYGLYLFTPVAAVETGGVPTLEARFFSPGMSGEDPATGSAAGPLAAYLHNHGVLRLDGDGRGKAVVHQGLRVGRRCVINVEVTLPQGGDKGAVDVDIVGSGVQVAKGEVLIPRDDIVF